MLLCYTFVFLDVDECTDSCHENADCVNSVGSFQCTCQNGYTGDGNTNCSGKPVILVYIMYLEIC